MKGKTVFNDDIFRIYIPFRKYLALEDILKKQNIQYSIDFEMPNSVTDVVRFYFDKKDKELVNDILIENGIETSDDFFTATDHKNDQKIFLLFLKFFGILALFVLIYYLIYHFFN